jgi:adenosylhomocysteine nucleosidase
MDKLIVSALEMETEAGKGGYPILHTGVGKVNAAIMLTKYLQHYQGFTSDGKTYIEEVINFGTAGSRNQKIGSLVKCTKFVQRDMDKTALGFKKGETAYETDVPMILDFGEGLVCGTGDNFVEDIKKELKIIDVFDMEAYALAKVCYAYNVPFTSYKYITDNANEKSAKDWKSNLADGIKIFEKEVIWK